MWKKLSLNLDGENGDMLFDAQSFCCTQVLADLYPEQYEANVLKIAEVRVRAAVKGDGNGHVSSLITFDDETGSSRTWFENVSDQGYSRRTVSSTYERVKEKNEFAFLEVKSVEIVDYHQDAIGTGANARVITVWPWLIPRLARPGLFLAFERVRLIPLMNVWRMDFAIV